MLELDFSGPQWPRRLGAQAASMLQLSRLRTEAVGVLPSLPWLPSLFSIWTAPTYFFSWTLRTSFSLEDKIEEAGSSEDQGQRIERAVRKSQRTPSTILFFTKREHEKDKLLLLQFSLKICKPETVESIFVQTKLYVVSEIQRIV